LATHLILLKLQKQFDIEFFRNLGTTWSNWNGRNAYDAVGNRLSSLGVSPYNVNTSNELTSTPSTTYTFSEV
jgi:hypothetical protein